MRLPSLSAMPGLPEGSVQAVQAGLAGLAELVEQVLAAGPRLAALLADAERLVGDADRVLGQVDALMQRVEATRVEAQRVVRRTDGTRSRADALLTALGAQLGPLERLQPTLERLAETTDPAEVDALVQLLDNLPVLARQVEGEVIPVMRSLGTVAPDVHDLLDLTQELNAMLGKLPGMGRIKKKVDEQQAADDA